MIIGGGVVGMNAAFIALGMEATVYVFDRNIDRLRELDIAMGGRADTCFASTLAIEERLPDMDLVIGAVLVRGAKAPHVVTRAQLGLMKRTRCWSTCRSTRAAALRHRVRPRTRTPPTRWTASRTTAWPNAGRGADHLHLRADQCHDALRHRPGQPGARGAVKATPASSWASMWPRQVTYEPVAEAAGVTTSRGAGAGDGGGLNGDDGTATPSARGARLRGGRRRALKSRGDSSG